MKKRMILISLLVVSLAVAVLFLSKPPVGEALTRDPQAYLETNRYVARQRSKRQQEGALHSLFLPQAVEDGNCSGYLSWYDCAFFGDPSYAITVTVSYPDRESYLAEYGRLTRMEGVSLRKGGDVAVIGYNVYPGVHGYLEPPVRDGSEYVMEYAIASDDVLTITYTECQLWEGQTCCEEILNQLRLLSSLDG